MDEKHEMTTQLFDDIIQKDPDFAEAAHYYKAHWLIKCQKDKDDVFKELQKARDLFSSRQMDNTSNACLVNMISQHYLESTEQSFTRIEGFVEQANHINEIVQTFIASIDAIVGQGINEAMLQEITVSADIDQSERKNQGDCTEEEQKKIPGDTYETKLLHDALLRSGILEPHRFRKVNAESSETKKILWSQYRYDTYDIIRSLKTFHDGQSVCPADLKDTMANSEEFWETVTQESTRTYFVLVSRESLETTRFSYSKLPDVLKEDLPPASIKDIFQRSKDTRYLYMIPKEVHLQEIEADKFLIYNKNALDSSIITFLKELNLYTEIVIGKLNELVETKPLARYDSIDVHALKMIDGMTNEQAEGIFKQLVGTGIITDTQPHRISEATLNDLESISLEDHSEYRDEVIEVIYHCFKYRFALARSLSGENSEEDDGIEDTVKRSGTVRMVPDFMMYSPHKKLFQNLVEMHVITQEKINEDIKAENNLDNRLDTLLQQRSNKDYSVISDWELHKWIQDPDERKGVLEEMEKLEWIDKDMIMAPAEDIFVRQTDRKPSTEGLLKSLLLAKIGLMPKTDIVKESILHWQSEYLKLDVPDSFLEKLEESFDTDDISNKVKAIMMFETIGLDKLIKLDEMKWTWSSIGNMAAIFLMGISQLAIGIAIEVTSQGTLMPFAKFFVSEGVGDIMFAVECAFRGHCTWKEYARVKRISVAMSVVTCGISTAISRGAQVPKSAIPSAIAKRFAKKVAVSVSTASLNSLIQGKVEKCLSHYLREISKAMLSDVRKEVKRHRMNEKLATLTKKIGPDAARAIVNRVNKDIMDATWSNESLDILQQIFDKVGAIANGLGDGAKYLSKSGHPRAQVIGPIAQGTATGILAVQSGLVLTEITKLSGIFLSRMDSKLEEQLDRFKDYEESFEGNEKFEEEIQQQWQDLIVRKMDEKLTSKVVIPVMKYFGNRMAKKCRKAMKSHYRKIQLQQHRRIFNSALDEYEQKSQMESQMESSGEADESTTDKGRMKNVQNAAVMKLQKKLLDLMYETDDPDLMAAICSQDIPLPMLFAKPLAVKLGRPIVIYDPDGKIIQTFSHYGTDNVEPIEITYEKGQSKKVFGHFYSTQFEDTKRSQENQDCLLRAINAAVASDEVIDREELTDILKTDNHMRDLITQKLHQDDFYCNRIGGRRRRKSESRRYIRNAHKEVISFSLDSCLGKTYVITFYFLFM